MLFQSAQYIAPFWEMHRSIASLERLLQSVMRIGMFFSATE